MGAVAPLEIPGPDGAVHKLLVRESPILSAELQARMPDVRTYAVTGSEETALTGRFDLTPAGFHAVIMSRAGAFLVEPDGAGSYRSVWLGNHRAGAFSCRVTSKVRALTAAPDFTFPAVFTQLQTLRLAVMVSAQFTQTNGGTQASAMAAVVTTVNATNAVYERDLSIHFNIVKMIVFASSSQEPFPLEEATGGEGLIQLGDLIDQQTGAANYDLGHTFTETNGGLATTPSACNDSIKAQGVSAQSEDGYTPTEFGVEQVAHEIGHQMGASHTFNANASGSCTDDNRNANTAFEVGSGITVMGYAGICGEGMDPQDLDRIGNGFMHAYTIKEIAGYAATLKCFAPPSNSTINHPPQVFGPQAFMVPANTPFLLTGSATDPDAQDQANLTYSWEELDLGAASPPNSDDGTRPLFRNYAPVDSPARYFPSVQYILDNFNTPSNRCPSNWSPSVNYLCGETIPDSNRTMRYRLTVRDNRGSDGITAGTMAFTDVMVTSTTAAGPFRVTAPGTNRWQAGETALVTWDVANTNRAPVNAATVRIKLSLDSGNTFPYVLASGVPNNGSAAVTIPVGVPAALSARVMVAAESNVFLDISHGNLQILAGPKAITAPVIFPQGVTSATGERPSLAPGSQISIFGENLSALAADAAAAPLPTQLGMTSVEINGVAAPLFYVSPGQINAQIPFEVKGGEAVVVVTSNGIMSPGVAVNITPLAPGIYQDPYGHALSINADGAVNSPGNPAKAGQMVTVYGTGQGPLSVPVTTGSAAPSSPAATTMSPTTVSVGGVPASVQFNGLAPGDVGLWQLSFTIPSLPPGAYPLVATVGGVSALAVTISVSD
jgi:uncharacterized protein (TIGR03437 family)